MSNLQKKLLNHISSELGLAKLEITAEQYEKIRGVTGIWNELDETAYITIYYDGEITETDVEIASDIGAYIAAHLTKGMLKEKYIRLDYPNQLPNSDFWGYKRSEK